MTGTGTVERLYVAPEAAADMRERTEVEAVAGAGLRGDRYFRERETGTFVDWDPTDERPSGYDVTLIEREALDAIEREAGVDLAPGAHRRNLVIRDAALNHLVDQHFRVGEVQCRGVRLCEPCDHLEGLTQDGALRALVHRGGLRADVVEGGTVAAGDDLVPLE